MNLRNAVLSVYLRAKIGNTLIVVDTLGLLIEVVVHAAHLQDREIVGRWRLCRDLGRVGA
jgi:hypothetical protein